MKKKLLRVVVKMSDTSDKSLDYESEPHTCAGCVYIFLFCRMPTFFLLIVDSISFWKVKIDANILFFLYPHFLPANTNTVSCSMQSKVNNCKHFYLRRRHEVCVCSLWKYPRQTHNKVLHNQLDMEIHLVCLGLSDLCPQRWQQVSGTNRSAHTGGWFEPGTKWLRYPLQWRLASLYLSVIIYVYTTRISPCRYTPLAGLLCVLSPRCVRWTVKPVIDGPVVKLLTDGPSPWRKSQGPVAKLSNNGLQSVHKPW